MGGGSELFPLYPPGSLLPVPIPAVSYLASTPDTWVWCGRRERVNGVSMGQRRGWGGSTGRGWPGTRSDTCVNTGDPHAGEVTQVCRDTQRGTCMAHARTDTHGNMHKPLTRTPTHTLNPQLQEGVWAQARTDTCGDTSWAGTQAPKRMQNDTRACRYAQVTAPHCRHTCTLAPPAGEGQDFLGATGESPALQGAGQRQAQQL